MVRCFVVRDVPLASSGGCQQAACPLAKEPGKTNVAFFTGNLPLKRLMPPSFVLAATEHLHRRIAKMSERIRQLEDALGELQSQHSTEPHPLLREDLLAVNHKDDESLTSPDESGTLSHPPEVLDTFGTLSITDHGISRFFGPTGGSEVGCPLRFSCKNVFRVYFNLHSPLYVSVF